MLNLAHRGVVVGGGGGGGWGGGGGVGGSTVSCLRRLANVERISVTSCTERHVR